MFVKVNPLRQSVLYPQLQRKTPSAMAGFSLFHMTSNKNKEAPGDEIPGLLMCGLAGGIRTHDRPLRHRGALSAELQPDTCAT